MSNFITKFFKFKKSTSPKMQSSPTTQSVKTAIPATSKPLIPPSVPRFLFDIDVYEADDSSHAPERLTGVISDSVETLRALYATCNQHIKIISKTPLPATPGQNVIKSPPLQSGPSIDVQPATVNIKERPPFQLLPTVEPKYITVSGIKMKIVGDIVYQKQWVRASDDETKEFRVVFDKTNKLVNLTGKHVELEKWIKIED